MRITILCVGKLKEQYLKDGIVEYAKRMPPYAELQVIEVADEKTPANASAQSNEKIKESEGKRLLAALLPNGHKDKDAYIIVLDSAGKNLSSPELAQKIDTLALGGTSHIVFVIGGSLGLSREVLQRGDFLLSFGKMTFPHQLMRLILLEQIYRAFKISRGETYHK